MKHPVSPTIAVAAMQPHELPTVVALLLAQQRSLHTLDPRLPLAHTSEALTNRLSAIATPETALVAHDQQGRVRGAVIPAVWEVSAESTLRAFLTARNGIARSLTLPEPQEADAEVVARALLVALSNSWRAWHTTGELIHWPSNDRWLQRVLLEQDFLLDRVCAWHPAGPPRFPDSRVPSSLLLRFAQPDDEGVLLRLYRDELRFHEACGPFANNTSGARLGFGRKLALCWKGASLEQGAPLVIVAVLQGQVVGMAQASLLEIAEEDEPGYTPPGRYWCIEQMCVREQVRGQGIGRHLVRRLFDIFAPYGLDGSLLWYHLDNPIAAHFWPRLGYVPLWNSYQRRRRIISS